MLEKLKKKIYSIYRYIEERYAIKGILSFILVGVAVPQIIIYYILDYFDFSSIIVTFILVAIPFSLFLITVATLILAFLGIQDKEKNSIFSYFALIGSIIPFIFLWHQNNIFVFLSITVAISIVLLMTYPIIKKIIVWFTGVAVLSYLGVMLFINRESFMEGITQLALIPIFIIGLLLGDVSLFDTEAQAYRKTLDISVPKEVKHLKMVDNSDYMMWGTYIGYSFSYKAEPSYFILLKNKLHNIPCEAPRNNLVCYKGTVNEYFHTINYNSKTKKVQHNVSNNRDY